MFKEKGYGYKGTVNRDDGKGFGHSTSCSARDSLEGLQVEGTQDHK